MPPRLPQPRAIPRSIRAADHQMRSDLHMLPANDDNLRRKLPEAYRSRRQSQAKLAQGSAWAWAGPRNCQGHDSTKRQREQQSRASTLLLGSPHY